MDDLQLCRRNRRRRSWLKATYTHIYGWTEKSLSPKIFFGKILHKQPSEMGERSLDFDANGSAALLRNHNILFVDHIMRANMCVLSDCFIFLGLLWSPVPWSPLSEKLRGLQWYPFPAVTDDIPYGYDICFADDICYAYEGERILYHIRSANISYGFNRISYRLGDISFQCFEFEYVHPIFGYHFKLIKDLMNTRTTKPPFSPRKRWFF